MCFCTVINFGGVTCYENIIFKILMKNIMCFCTVWDGGKTGDPWERQICKRNSIFCLSFWVNFPKEKQWKTFFPILSARARARARTALARRGASGPYPKKCLAFYLPARARASGFRHPGGLKILYSVKYDVFIKAKSIEFRLQFRGTQSFRSPIRWFYLLWKSSIYEKYHVFIKAKSIEFRLQFMGPLSFRSPIWWCYLLWKYHF